MCILNMLALTGWCPLSNCSSFHHACSYALYYTQPHMDWIDDHNKREVHNFDSHRKGTNRFATILLYMSDLGEGAGGETLFKNAWPIDLPEDQRKSRDVALEELRESGEANFLKKGSWEETMVADCRSRLAVRPHSARAVLFYSQHPNGEEDTSSLHGGCPVLHGEKWAVSCITLIY